MRALEGPGADRGEMGCRVEHREWTELDWWAYILRDTQRLVWAHNTQRHRTANMKSLVLVYTDTHRRPQTQKQRLYTAITGKDTSRHTPIQAETRGHPNTHIHRHTDTQKHTQSTLEHPETHVDTQTHKETYRHPDTQASTYRKIPSTHRHRHIDRHTDTPRTSEHTETHTKTDTHTHTQRPADIH